MGRLDPSKQRRAPRLPTPISFPDPTIAIEKETRAWSAQSPPDMESLRQLWQYWPPKKNQRYGREMWETINVTFRPPEKIEDVVGGDGVWTPPPSWLDEPTAEERTQVRHSRALPNGRLEDQDPPTLFNTRSWPTRKDFYDKVSELKYRQHGWFSRADQAEGGGQAPAASRPRKDILQVPGRRGAVLGHVLGRVHTARGRGQLDHQR